MSELVQQIRQLADAFPAGAPIAVHQLASGAAFVARGTHNFAEVRPQRPLFAVVLAGKKSVTHAGKRLLLRAGDVLIAPADVAYQCSVTPETDGEFAAFVIEICGIDLGAFETDRIHVVRGDELALQAFAHLARTLLTPKVSAPLLAHRLTDVILSLSHLRQPTSVAVPDLVLAIRGLLRKDLSHAWPAEEVAKKLSMSSSTMRRQLAEIGVSLRQLRAEERMSVAATLLRQRNARIADVAAQCGYDSPSKFAKQYRRRFGHAPSETGATTSRRGA